MGERGAATSNVEISLTADEALVLFEFLSRFSDSGALTAVDQAPGTKEVPSLLAARTTSTSRILVST
jgi:hypothetical protein